MRGKLTGVLFILMIAITSCKKKEDPGPNEVFLQNYKFNPSELTVQTGTTVRFVNKDGVTHTVTEKNNLFNSGDMRKGDVFEYTFTNAGTYDLYCKYHSGMTGKIIVQ